MTPKNCYWGESDQWMASWGESDQWMASWGESDQWLASWRESDQWMASSGESDQWLSRWGESDQWLARDEERRTLPAGVGLLHSLFEIRTYRLFSTKIAWIFVGAVAFLNIHLSRQYVPWSVYILRLIIPTVHDTSSKSMQTIMKTRRVPELQLSVLFLRMTKSQFDVWNERVFCHVSKNGHNTNTIKSIHQHSSVGISKRTVQWRGVGVLAFFFKD